MYVSGRYTRKCCASEKDQEGPGPEIQPRLACLSQIHLKDGPHGPNLGPYAPRKVRLGYLGLGWVRFGSSPSNPLPWAPGNH